MFIHYYTIQYRQHRFHEFHWGFTVTFICYITIKKNSYFLRLNSILAVLVAGCALECWCLPGGCSFRYSFSFHSLSIFHFHLKNFFSFAFSNFIFIFIFFLPHPLTLPSICQPTMAPRAPSPSQPPPDRPTGDARNIYIIVGFLYFFYFPLFMRKAIFVYTLFSFSVN